MEETPSSPKDLVFEFIRRNVLFAVLISIGLTLSGIGGFQYFASKNTTDIEFVNSEEKTDVLDESSTNQDITVDVAGEVKNPGVFVLKDGARLKDAIESAGGFTVNADTEYISKSLNLAQKINDGGKIYIPGKNESTTDTPAIYTIGAITSNSSGTTIASSLININTASSESLDTLPKVGPVTAQKIIDARPYTSKEELVSKKVVTQKTFDGLKDKITTH